MPAYPQTPNLKLALPPPSQWNQIPNWAELMNNNFQTLDKFVPSASNPLTPSAFNINKDLDFQGFSAKNLFSAAFENLRVDPSTLATIYFNGNEFWVADGVGNQVQLTDAGSPAGPTGNIGGLPSSPAGAGIAWNNSLSAFVLTGKGGNTRPQLITGPLKIYDSAAGPPSNGVGLLSPVSLAASFDLTLPAGLPASTLPLSVAADGTMSIAQIATAQIADAAVTRAKAFAVTPVQSPSSGVWGTGGSATTPTIVTAGGLGVTPVQVSVTTDGKRPIYIACVANDGLGSPGNFTLKATGAAGFCSMAAVLDIIVNPGLGGQFVMATSLTSVVPTASTAQGSQSWAPSAICGISFPAAGTYVFALRYAVTAGTSFFPNNVSLVAWEM